MKTKTRKLNSIIRTALAAVLSLGILGALAPVNSIGRQPPARPAENKPATKPAGKGKAAPKGKQSPAQSSTAATVQSTVSFTGNAGVVAFTENGVNLVTLGQTDVLASGGGSVTATLEATNILGNILHVNALNLQSAQSSTVGAANQTHSETTINGFSTIVVSTNGMLHTISFDTLKVEADATATANGVVKTGSTMITGLVIDNVPITVTGEANQVVNINGGTITINAQSTSGSDNQGEISVAGLLIALQGCLSGPIGFARAGISFTGTPPPPPPSQIDFGGGATVVYVTNRCTGRDLTIGATGSASQNGGILEITVGPTNASGPSGTISLITGEGLTIGSANQTHSEVTVDDFSATLIGTNGISHNISFDFLKVRADAQATSGGATVSGSTILNGLVIDNVPITVTGAANQMIALSGGGTVVINAQTSTVNGNQGAITVVGLTITVDNCLIVTVGVAQAAVGFTGNPPPPPPGQSGCDKLTGGGFIIATEGAKGSFGVSGGIRRGQFWGHLNYIDHATGMHVKSTSVTGYAVIDAVTRRIDYNVDVDGSAGTCTVIAADHGEPGRNDIFDITVSNGYHAGGDLGGSGSGGGNIQLHKCPPGWNK
jgi:hypothetical protein